MADIPFRTFEGYLKQHDPTRLSEEEQALLSALFPLFQGSDSEELRPRRFAGAGLLGRCYHSVAQDAAGDDQQTLAHELRAYRNPLAVGMVEVVDLANGCELEIGSAKVPFKPDRALAILIHGPERLPARCQSIAFRRIPGLDIQGIGGQEALLYRLPYVVSHRRIENCIDLRFADARQWFFETFRVLDQSDDAQHPTAQHEHVRLGQRWPAVAMSRFVRGQGHHEEPRSFWNMLPTLVNPELGGGDAAGPGAALHVIGEWMRNHGVGALVYPSARADVRVHHRDGVMVDFRGWNLVDYTTSAELRRVRRATTVLSPWAWLSFPQGVKLGLPVEDSPLRDSFVIEGMVDYWARNYLAQVRGLRRARLSHGESSASAGDLVWCACLLGILLVRWLRLVFDGGSKEEVDPVILEIVGLGLPRGLYQYVGRVVELHEDVRAGKISADDLENGAADVVDLVRGHFGRHSPQVEEAMCMGYDLETTVMALTATVRGHAVETSAMLARTIEPRIASWARTGQLPRELLADVGTFSERAMAALRQHGPDSPALVLEAEDLQRRVLEALRGR
jgi:hypothetical protein